MEPEYGKSRLTSLVLLVDPQESTGSVVEGVLRPKGHVVLRVSTGQQALDLAAKVSPGAILIDANLPDLPVSDVIRELRASSTRATTPILMVTSTALGRAARLEALDAGAWDILTRPLDPNELIVRLDTFVRVKHQSDRVHDAGLTDLETGLYNLRGILQRVKEISADALRSQRPLTCVAFGLASREAITGEGGGLVAASAEIGEPMSTAIQQVTRSSDTIGRMGPSEFVVIAPDTDEAGAVRLANRVLEALEANAKTRSETVAQTSTPALAGLFAQGIGAHTAPEDLLLRATMALRTAQAEQGSFRVTTFDA